jgi:hypothetical protein
LELCLCFTSFVTAYLEQFTSSLQVTLIAHHINTASNSSNHINNKKSSTMSQQPKSVRSSFELTGRTYVVTGGAQGIGFTISRAICEMGGNVAIWDIQDKVVDQQEFDSWTSTFGSRTLYVQTDVTKQESLQAAFQKTLDKFETIDGCVPSAGIAIDKPFVDQTWEEFTRIQEINVRTTDHLFDCDFTDSQCRCEAHFSQHNWSRNT